MASLSLSAGEAAHRGWEQLEVGARLPFHLSPWLAITRHGLGVSGALVSTCMECALFCSSYFSRIPAWGSPSSAALQLSPCLSFIYLAERSSSHGFQALARQVLLSGVIKRPQTQQHDLHPHRYSASLPEPFRPPERTLASPFLTSHQIRSLLKRGPSNGAIFFWPPSRPKRG